MAKFQLWSRDEYGQGSILHTAEDINELIKEAKKQITDINVNNALTTDDRERNWEAYMVNISVPKKSDKTYLCGENKVIYEINKKGEVKTASLENIPKAEVKIYLGNISTTRTEEKDWFATDVRKRPITTTNHQELEGKTSFFVKVV